jgi:hypothetical protein
LKNIKKVPNYFKSDEKIYKMLTFLPKPNNILIMSQNGKPKNFIHLLGDKLFIELSFDCFPWAEESAKNFIPTAKKINQCSSSQTLHSLTSSGS